jgi:hypothetical protein
MPSVTKGRQITFSGVKYAAWFTPVPPLQIFSEIDNGVLRVLGFNQDHYLLFFGETPVVQTKHDTLPRTTIINELTEADAIVRRTRIIDGVKYIVAAFGGQGICESEEWHHQSN